MSSTELGLSGAAPVYVQEFSITEETGTEPKFVIGKRSPHALLESPSVITGSFTKPFEDTTFANKLGIQSSGEITDPEKFVLGVFPQGFGDGNDALIIDDVMVTSWGVDVGPDDVTEESVDWMGKNVRWKFCEQII